jgi:hypothetical protein
MNRTALALLVACLLAAPRAGTAADEGPTLVDNTAQTGPESCPARTGSQLELRRVSDLDPAAREVAATADRNSDGLVCIEAGAFDFRLPPYMDDTIVYSDWWPATVHCMSAYWPLHVGLADPLRVYDHNHDLTICKRIL